MNFLFFQVIRGFVSLYLLRMAAMDSLRLHRPATRLTQLWTEPSGACVWPDCWRTVIAMLLSAERPEEVPHFGDFVPGDPVPDGMGRAALKAWLHDRGIEMVEIPLPKWSASAIEDRLECWLKSCPAMLEGRTAEGHQHCVAVIDGKVVDTVPWTEANPIVEPGSDGLFWLTILAPKRSSEATGACEAVAGKICAEGQHNGGAMIANGDRLRARMAEQFAAILAADPICGGRVTHAAVEALAAEAMGACEAVARRIRAEGQRNG